MTTMTPVAGGKMRGVGETTREDASDLIKAEIQTFEHVRKELAQAYAFAAGHSTVEYELGECLIVVRKAIKRLGEAWTELAQQELPFGRD